MKRKYDVIIVGAGPAGLSCADELKNSDFSVLIVEKNLTIGPKICGGGITGLVSKYYIPNIKSRKFPKLIAVLDNNQQKVDFVNPLKTIDRYDLGQHQLKNIENAKNITVIKDTKVNYIKNKTIFTDKGKFYFKYIVGADGSNSIVRKHLGLNTKLCVGILCYVIDITNDLIWNFYPNDLKSGYLWVFPHKDYTNIGVYFDPKFVNSKNAKKTLIKYLNENGYEFYSKDFKGGIVNYDYQGCIFGDVFLIGDAAGLASKVWGEGIPHALVSGREIGKKIINKRYNLKELKQTIKIKKRQEQLSYWMDLFPNLQSFFINLFIKLISGEWFQHYFGIVTPIIVKESKKGTQTKELSTEINWVRFG